MELNERKKQILKSLIDAYIDTGEPIGSKYLFEHLDIGVSPATIRNELNELVGLGFLEQLHTSSGRIPSNTGYRVYVDSLMNKYRLTLNEIMVLNSLMNNKIHELNDVITHATRLLSEITNYTAIGVTTKPKKGTLTKFEGVYIGSNSFLLVMISSNESAKSRQIYYPFAITYSDVFAITSFLNDNLSGLPLSSITKERLYDIPSLYPQSEMLLSRAVQAVWEMLEEITSYQMSIDGISNLLEYPEFSDMSKTKKLLAMLEERTQLIDKLKLDEEKSLNVFIGSEDERLDKTSLVLHTFKADNGTYGVVGLIGPKRMNYSGAIARLEYISKKLIEQECSNFGRDNNNEG